MNVDELQALQREAMKRVADIVEQVQDELTRAQEEMARKYFSDADPEPVFVFRAQDGLAMAAITSYYSACLIAGLKDHAAEVNKAMQEFRGWQTRNPDRMKMPDKKHVPVPEIRKSFADPPIPDDFPHGKMPRECDFCPDPTNPSPTFHQTGAAHTVRTGPNSWAQNTTRNIPFIEGVKHYTMESDQLPRVFYNPDNTTCCSFDMPCERHAHFADPKQYEYPSRPIRDDPQA
jgi:hypothetical protein